LDVCHTSTHGVALVQISDAGLKPAARGSLKTQGAKKSPKITIWAPSHNFVGLYLGNYRKNFEYNTHNCIMRTPQTLTAKPWESVSLAV